MAQVTISGAVLFILYRYLYDRLGVEQIGIWSLVTSITSISRIGDFGLSASVVKFVAQALGRRDPQRAADVVQTAVLTLGSLMAVFLVVGYPLFILVLGYFLPATGVPIALSILPYTMMSLWMMVIVGVFSGGLDGCLRMDLRGLLIGSSYTVYLGLAMLLVPKYGLKGVVMAQLIQSVGLMIMLWWILKGQLKDLPLIPWHWKLSVLKEMLGYGVKIQITSIMNMLFDPVVKAMMSKFGGLEALGYYGMANNLILQGRAMIVEASRIMVPTIAALQEKDSDKKTKLFIFSYRITKK
jgi:O-antigen/teichoic acid export membrane protein